MDTEELYAKMGEALDKLAENCEDVECVVNRLKEIGIKGDHHGVSCPVTNYLKKELSIPSGDFITTNLYDVAIYASNGYQAIAERELPSIITRFVQTFDAGYYPDNRLEWYNDLYQEQIN